MDVHRYTLLGLCIILLMTVFVFFSNEDNLDYDYTGIVSDVRQSENGFTFTLNTSDGDEIRCFFRQSPLNLGYYAVSGSFSSDGNIMFVSMMKNLDDFNMKDHLYLY